MERFNAMGREFNINNEVMCRIDDGEYVLYEDARIAIDAKQAEIDALKALLHVEAEANNAARDEVDRLRALYPKTIKPTVDADGFYACECGHIVGCDGRERSIRYLKKPFCADCGARIDWTGIPVWEWVHGERVTVIEKEDETHGEV